MPLTSTVINLTPHAVAVFDDDRSVAHFPATGVVARIREIVGTPITVHTEVGQVPLVSVSYAQQVDGLPQPVDGVLYLVSRVTAAAVRRNDLVFPQDEVRDADGRIVGCRALGTFSSTGTHDA